MTEKKGKSRSSDGERILKCDYFIAGNSNPAVVPLAAVIFNHKIVFNKVTEKGLPFEVD